MKFPKEVGLPRKIVFNIREYLNFVNLYNGKKKNIFESVYNGNIINNKIKYNDIIIDKLFFDFDLENSWEEANKLHQHLIEKQIKHQIFFSGRGFHLFILTNKYKAKYTKSCIYNAQTYFINLLDLKCDKQIVGDASRMRRIANTFNIKRKRFCIPLLKKEFKQGYEYCKELAKKQNFKNEIIGKTLLDLKHFDYKSERENEKMIFNEEDFEDSNNANYMEDAPNCIKRLLNSDHIGWKDRYLIILFYKEIGYTKQEVLNILKQHLSPAKLKHCIQDERQLQYLFERDLTFPTCNKIISDGYCGEKCAKYNKIIYK